MRKIAILIVPFLFLSMLHAQPQKEKSNGKEKQEQVNNFKKSNKMSTTDQYTFQLSDKVSREKVTFKNRYGITLSGDLYLPKNAGEKALPALAVSGPYGAVKEQASGLYGNQMAQRGFAVLALDPSYTGESSGEPRNLASPEIFTEDFSAAVDFLGVQQNVDRNKIGIIGICGFGGFALNAVAVDKRVKAVATLSMYNMSRITAKGYFDGTTHEELTKTLEKLGEQRWKDAESGTFEYGPQGLPEKIKGDEPQFVKDYVDYYKTARGFHVRSINSNGAWTATTPISLINMPILANLKDIAPRPMLLIAGENAHSRYLSEDIYKEASQPKELMIIPNAVHTDLYDKVDVIPFDKLEKFFRDNF